MNKHRIPLLILIFFVLLFVIFYFGAPEEKGIKSSINHNFINLNSKEIDYKNVISAYNNILIFREDKILKGVDYEKEEELWEISLNNGSQFFYNDNNLIFIKTGKKLDIINIKDGLAYNTITFEGELVSIYDTNKEYFLIETTKSDLSYLKLVGLFSSKITEYQFTNEIILTASLSENNEIAVSVIGMDNIVKGKLIKIDKDSSRKLLTEYPENLIYFTYINSKGNIKIVLEDKVLKLNESGETLYELSIDGDINRIAASNNEYFIICVSNTKSSIIAGIDSKAQIIKIKNENIIWEYPLEEKCDNLLVTKDNIIISLDQKGRIIALTKEGKMIGLYDSEIGIKEMIPSCKGLPIIVKKDDLTYILSNNLEQGVDK